MNSPINNGSIKLACLQITPGHELTVKEQLEKACEKIGIKDFVIFKCFGAFDIILLYVGSDFDFNLSKAGPIPYILKSNILLCYSYLKPKNLRNMITTLRNSTFSGMSLLKINPHVQKNFPDVENAIRLVLKDEEDHFLLFSLGWNEILLIICDSEPNKITDSLFSLTTLRLDKNHSLFIKTLSFICLNHRLLPQESQIRKGFKAVIQHFEAINKFPNLVINPDIYTTIPFIEISSKPGFVDEIKNYFSSKGFLVHETLGRHDFIINPDKQIEWNYFLSAVLYFRYKFKAKLFSTNIRFRILKEIETTKHYNEIPFSIRPIKFSYITLRKIFSDEVASGLSNDLYSLNSLIQNPIYGNVFADMSKYPRYLISLGKKLRDVELIRTARDVLKIGAEIRSYGTFDAIEEVKNRFSEIRGGAQRALLAIEFLPTYIFRRLNNKAWKGFIIAGNYKFHHINEVINVPTDALWNPKKWWALYHEIAHILVDETDWINYETPSVKLFLADKIDQESWLALLLELASETIGFELGFFNNYKLFYKIFWQHIVDIDAANRKVVSIDNYAMRSFFIYIFRSHFYSNPDLSTLSKEDFTNLDFLYKKFLAHLDSIEKDFPSITFPKKIFLAAEVSKTVKQLYPFSKYLSEIINTYDFAPPMKALKYKNTKYVVDSINRGNIWWNKIKCPEAIIYNLIQKANLPFNKKIATIMTFWNQMQS